MHVKALGTAHLRLVRGCVAVWCKTDDDIKLVKHGEGKHAQHKTFWVIG